MAQQTLQSPLAPAQTPQAQLRATKGKADAERILLAWVEEQEALAAESGNGK